MYADAVLSKEDTAEVARSERKPLFVYMGMGMRSRKTTLLMPLKELEAVGVRVVSYPRMLSTAALRGMMNAMAAFKDDVIGRNHAVDRPDLQVSFEELNDLMGMGHLDELERRFFGG